MVGCSNGASLQLGGRRLAGPRTRVYDARPANDVPDAAPRPEMGECPGFSMDKLRAPEIVPGIVQRQTKTMRD